MDKTFWTYGKHVEHLYAIFHIVPCLLDILTEREQGGQVLPFLLDECRDILQHLEKHFEFMDPVTNL